jgi:ElaB/YqjD/DUF883 family membrane-anchored ribosome-binding protein
MARPSRSEYREIRDIKSDLDSLKANIVALTNHLQSDGIDKARALTSDLQDTALDMTGKVVAEGNREVHELEKQVKNNPGKSMLFAFGAGLLANALLSRR